MKFLFDLFPVILFFIAFKVYGVFTATAVAMVATAAQIGWMWFRHRKVDTMMWVSLAVITLFGGATLLLQDELFIKWKPTVIYWLLGIVLLISSSFFKKNLIRTMLEKQIALPIAIWSKLNFSWAVFFIFMGCINLYVAFGYSLDTWVTFKLFGSTGLMLVFVALQVVMLGKHMQDIAPSVAEGAAPGEKIVESKIKDQ